MKNSTKNSTTLLVINFLLLLTVFLPTKAQAQMTDKEYAVINAVYDNAYLYRRTLFHKNWAHYFGGYLEEIFNRSSFSKKVSNKELKEKLNKHTLYKIRDAIMMLKPLKIASRKLNPNIKLTRYFDTQEAVKKGVIRISKPIIIDGKIAVLKQESLYEAPIFILEKKEGEWGIIYTFYDWYIID